jgi:hypothetical protein
LGQRACTFRYISSPNPLWTCAAGVCWENHYKVDDLCVSPFMRSLSAERNACFVRILITISPRLYREVLALCIRRRSPDFDVLLAPPWPLDGRAERFGPHVLVQDADEAGLPPALEGGVVCRIRILKTDRIDATIELNGMTSELRDACLEDMFVALEEAERLSQGDSGG